MSDHDCDCADQTVGQATEHAANTDGWLAERPARAAQFPSDVAENMSRFFGEPIDTFDDVISAIRDIVDGDGIAVEELCRVEEQTPHYAETDDETYYFRCFYDGIALAHLVDEPVEIRTETPMGEPIEIQVSPEGDLDVTPSGAVMSFGVTTDGDVTAGGTTTPQDVYGAICPYVQAFSTREEYERWAEDVAATTVGLPPESGNPIAAALTATSPSEGTE